MSWSIRDARASWLGLRDIVRGAHPQVFAALLVGLGQTAMLLPIALLVRQVFDVDIPHHHSAGIVITGLLIASCYAASALLSTFTQALAARAAKIALARVRRRLIATMELLPLSWHDRHGAGSVHEVVVRDCERVDRMIYAVVSQSLPAAMAVAALAVIAVIINPVLFLVTVVFVPLTQLSARRFMRAFRHRLAIWHETAAAFSAHTQMMLRGVATIRAAGAERRDRVRFEEEIARLTEAAYRVAMAGSRYQAMHGGVAAVAGVAVLVVGGLLVAGRSLSLGGLIAFYAVVALMLRQTTAAQAAGPVIAEGRLAMSRVSDLAAAVEPGAYSGSRKIRFGGATELDRVSLTYEGSERPALDDVTVRIRSGEHVCVVGPSGAGKTSLMAVILGLYRPQNGRVTADGVSLSELDLTDLRRQCGVILQDTVLFRGTLRENLLLAAPDADADAMLTALRAAVAEPIIHALPAGLETQLGDDGTGLSGGERQRIGIARALLARSPLILLDEPTANLPRATSAEIVENLTRLPWAPTVIVISHDPTVAAQIGRVLHMREGRLLDPAAQDGSINEGQHGGLRTRPPDARG